MLVGDVFTCKSKMTYWFQLYPCGFFDCSASLMLSDIAGCILYFPGLFPAIAVFRLTCTLIAWHTQDLITRLDQTHV